MLIKTIHVCFIDIDECARGTHNCDLINGDCIDTDGSFQCLCDPGFSGDGTTCTGKNISVSSCCSFSICEAKHIR